MPYNLPLVPRRLASQGWKVKIRDRERLEPPHITVIFGPHSWRIGLREHDLMDGGRWSEIDEGVLACIRAQWEVLCAQWNLMYPDNPV